MHILFITRHYPPEISGGARRPYLYVQALRQAGHRVTLVTPFDIDDPDRLVVPNAAITRGLLAKAGSHKVPAKRSLMMALKDKIRPWVFWPDDNISWAKDVVKMLCEHAVNPDWILTTSPPESVHYAGYKLAQKTGAPWIAEMRDTWVKNPHRIILERSKFRAWGETRMAKKYLRRAAVLTSVSEAVMSEMRILAGPSKPELIVSHFSNASGTAFAFDPDALNLVHTGGFTLSDRRRLLGPLLASLDEISELRPEIIFHIAGPLSGDEQKMITQAKSHVEWHGSVPLEQARAMQYGADGLVLYSPHGSHALPGKYAEYAMTNRPILYFGGGEWLDLAEKPNNLRPFAAGAAALQKNENLTASAGLTDDIAAERLIAFLEKSSAAT